MPIIADEYQSAALEEFVDGVEIDIIKELFTEYTLEDLQVLLEYHTNRENFNICAAIRDCIQERTK
jgi:hypothetical protein